MAVVVGELIAVVFVDMELFILNLPARTANLDHPGDIGGVDVEVGNPTIGIEQLTARSVFPPLDIGAPDRTLQRSGYLAHEPIGIRPLPCPAARGPLSRLGRVRALGSGDRGQQGRMGAGVGD